MASRGHGSKMVDAPSSASSIGGAVPFARSISGSGGIASVRALMADSLCDFQHKLYLPSLSYVAHVIISS